MTNIQIWSLQEMMLNRVAVALGPELVREVAFVGGCTVGLLVTDQLVRESVRYTDDVDIIVHVLGPGSWYQLEQRLAGLGFQDDPEDTVLCRKRLRDRTTGDLIVDFMPNDEKILGFSNRWYTAALMNAVDHALSSGEIIRVVAPAHFLGTKIEAWRGRGNNDPLSSQDVEDILNVIDGRSSLISEVEQAEPELRHAIAEGIDELLAHPMFDYAVQSAAGGSLKREQMLFQRLEQFTMMRP
ncbi:MAG: hypothetical protein IPK97_20100 [Ahniella sp.]|nr:hypothetical protein [Ahniella sp.]